MTLISAKNYEDEPCPQCEEVGELVLDSGHRFYCDVCGWDSDEDQDEDPF